MKAVILLILSCASLMAADTNVQVSLSFSTNLSFLITNRETGAVFTTGEAFIRETSVSFNRETGDVSTTETFIDSDVSDYGQTNLVRITKRRRGAVIFRSQQFYHHGEPVASFIFQDGVQSFDTCRPGNRYHVHLELLPSKERCVMIGGEDSSRDLFYPTNGVYYPFHFPRESLYLE